MNLISKIGKQNVLHSFFILVIIILLISCSENSSNIPKAKVVKLDAGDNNYLQVLGGPPETVTMHSGLVILEPDSSVGRHNTENYEELLVIFEGKGEMRMASGNTLMLEPGFVAYCPPHTEHNVFNTGFGLLRYLYVVADTK